jgi:BirA family biotin operon repressor/biotin-[acetyl-CoA-carboxylase] ligase
VVIAETQTAGIGRHGHSWHSETGGGLYMSIILRLPLAAETLPVLTMALGLAVQRTIEQVCGIQCDIRWPNDLILGERKVAGIMVQTADQGVLIAGIGININQDVFPEELREIATSLRIEAGREFEKEPLPDAVAAEALKYAGLLVDSGKTCIIEEFEARSSYVRGKAVAVDTGERQFSGTTAGLDENGFLRVETANGVETVISGGVRPAAVSAAPASGDH